MSKLDNIILECANKVLDGKQETLGGYIDPTKQQIKELMILELSRTFNKLRDGENTAILQDHFWEGKQAGIEKLETAFRKRVEEL